MTMQQDIPAGPAPRRLRILQIIGSIDPEFGGPIDGALNFARIWMERGCDVEFLTLDDPASPYLSGWKVHAFGHYGRPGRPSLWRRLRTRLPFGRGAVRWLRVHVDDYDAVVVHALWNYSILVASRVLPKAGVPYFVFPHGALDPWFRKAYPAKHAVKRVSWRMSEGPLINHATAVLFTTAEEQHLADRSFRPYHVKPRVVGFGSADMEGDAAVNERAFRAVLPALGERPYFLFLSRIHPKKGCDLLIDAFASIAGACDTDLVIAGPDQVGWKQALMDQAERRGVARRVHWPGMISGDIKWGAFAGARAFTLPSHSENFGIVVAEALACRTPVLISDKVNLWREVADAGAGIVRPDTAQGAESLLHDLIALSPEAAAAMRDRARACFETNFRFEATAERVLGMIEAVAA